MLRRLLLHRAVWAATPTPPKKPAALPDASVVAVHPDHSERVAYLRPRSAETSHVVLLPRGTVLDVHAKGGLEWHPGDDGALYWTAALAHEPVRASQLWRWKDGHPPQLVFQELDARFTLELGASKDGRVLRLGCVSHGACEYWSVGSGAVLQRMGPRREEGRTYAAEGRALWYMDQQLLLWDGAPCWQAPVASSVTAMDVWSDHWALWGYADTVPTCWRDGSEQQWPHATAVVPHDNLQWPGSCDVATPPRGVQLCRLRSERGGVPVTLLLPSAPIKGVVMGVYGAYGSVVPVDVDDVLVRVLLQRGVAVAAAHIRGGGMLGPAWAAAGRGALRSHADVVDALHVLPPRAPVVLWARSAGAYAAALALHAEPHRFAGALLEVPFVNARAADGLTAFEEREWRGSPDPLDTLPAQHLLPPLYVTAARGDSRVQADAVAQYARAAGTCVHWVDSHFASTRAETVAQLEWVLDILRANTGR